MSENNSTTGWTKLYHPAGPQVTIPLDLVSEITPDLAARLVRSVDALLLAGFSVNAPGLDDGELAEEVSAVCRREGKDEVVILDFYSSNERLVKKFMHVYMNGPADIDAFEAATGMKVPSLPTYDGRVAIERTDPKANKYVRALPRPIKLVFSINQKWTEWKAGDGQGQEPHKRLLVRYDSGRTAQTPATPAPAQPRAEKPAATQKATVTPPAATSTEPTNGKRPYSSAELWTKLATLSGQNATKPAAADVRSKMQAALRACFVGDPRAAKSAEDLIYSVSKVRDVNLVKAGMVHALLAWMDPKTDSGGLITVSDLVIQEAKSLLEKKEEKK